MTFEKRTHIVPIGFEIDRVVEPILEDNASIVYLITNNEVIKGDEKRGKYCLDHVKMALDKRINEVQVVNMGNKSDFFNFYKLMSEICYLVRKEKEIKGNKVFINISAGSTISGIVGTLVAQSYEVDAYYTEPDKYTEGYGKDCKFFIDNTCTFYETDSKHRCLPLTTGMKDNVLLPLFGIIPPEDDQLHALKIISEFPAGTTQENIIIRLIEENLGSQADKDDLSMQGFTDKLRSRFRRKFFNKLMEEGLIERLGSKRNPKWAITPDGKTHLELFWKAAEYVIKNKNIKH